jgi:DMSO reductase anchor subunit
MANKVYDYYKDLPSWAKGVTVVGGLVIAYIIGNRIYKGIKASTEFRGQKETLKDFVTSLKNLVNCG